LLRQTLRLAILGEPSALIRAKAFAFLRQRRIVAMKLPCRAATLLTLLLAAQSALGVDLTKLDRTIAKEPAYQSKSPTYGLLDLGIRNCNDRTREQRHPGIPPEPIAHAQLPTE
jgi:hypothetical protein